jgi:ABC-type multidrug transport system fused ATPase/permease subunit
MDIEVKSEDSGNKHLNNMVAITVVIFAVFMAVANVKGDNINQAMQKAKAESVDAWAEYQAARIKLHVDENGLAMLRLMETSGQVDKAMAAKQAAEYEADIKKYQERSKETRAKAEGLEAEYERLNLRDDQFDLSQAFLAMATALAAIAALVELSWVLYFAWATGAFGLFMGMAGFLGLPFRSAFLAALLGT